MKRWGRHGLTIVSLLVALAAMVIGARSYLVSDEAGHASGDEAWIVSSASGGVTLRHRQFHQSYFNEYRTLTEASSGGSADDAAHRFCGFAFSNSVTGSGSITHEVFLTIPYWAIFVAASVLPARWVMVDRKALMRRRKVAQGLCPTCGYDVRATPERCPECGSRGTAFTEAA